MASSLFSNSNGYSQPTNPFMSRVNQIKQMMNGNPQGLYNTLMQSNPQFRTFVQNNQGKSPQQIAQENGIDFNQLQNLMK